MIRLGDDLAPGERAVRLSLLGPQAGDTGEPAKAVFHSTANQAEPSEGGGLAFTVARGTEQGEGLLQIERIARVLKS